MKNDQFVKLQDVISLFLEYGELKQEGYMETTTPTHGPCCTCRECGYDHDNCVCLHNELWKDIENLKKYEKNT